MPWSSQQKTRTDLRIVEAHTNICENYRIACESLPDRVIVNNQNSSSIICSFARELIAENFSHGKPWYYGFSSKITSNELFKTLIYERSGLNQMIKQGNWDQESEKLFIQVCHEAISRNYGKLSNDAKKRKEEPNFERENIKIKTGIGRCKNADTFRSLITDFWSRAGQIPTLQNHWSELLDLLAGRGKNDWKVARDLALLALASYKGKEKEEQEELDVDS